MSTEGIIIIVYPDVPAIFICTGEAIILCSAVTTEITSTMATIAVLAAALAEEDIREGKKTATDRKNQLL